MATLVEEADLPRNRAGELMTGGLFAVAKSGDQDRLIFDRRPENAAMASLDWVSSLAELALPGPC